jgi:hypothetical protein
MTIEPLLRNDDAAAYMLIKSATLRKWRWQKVGPVYYKMNGAIRYKQSDLDKYMEDCAIVNG